MAFVVAAAVAVALALAVVDVCHKSHWWWDRAGLCNCERAQKDIVRWKLIEKHERCATLVRVDVTSVETCYLRRLQSMLSDTNTHSLTSN